MPSLDARIASLEAKAPGDGLRILRQFVKPGALGEPIMRIWGEDIEVQRDPGETEDGFVARAWSMLPARPEGYVSRLFAEGGALARSAELVPSAAGDG